VVGEREANIKGAIETKVEEDLVEIGDMSFVTIVEDQDTTCETAQIRCVFHVDIVLNLTTQLHIVWYC